jgi:hypothetical protein
MGETVKASKIVAGKIRRKKGPLRRHMLRGGGYY